MASSIEFARLVARPIDRVHIAASTVPSREELHAIEGYAVSPGDAALVAAFVNRDGMSWEQLRVPLRYAPEERLRSALRQAADAGVITFDEHAIAFTSDGLVSAIAVLDARAVALEEMWSNSSATVAELLELLTPVAVAATEAGGPSAHLETSTLRSSRPTAASKLWRVVAGLRRFRADAHAQAWSEAGHSVESIVALDIDSVERIPIEARTNELAATVWNELAETDQLAVLAGLASLDGSGTPT